MKIETSNLFIIYSNKTLELMEMIHDGKCDTNEADILREYLTDSQHLLTETEKQLVENLAGDLYMIYNEGMYFSVPDDKKQEQFNKLKIAFDENNWIEVFNILRGNLNLPEYLIASYRGHAWSKLGNNNIALKFYQYAKKIKPENTISLTCFLCKGKCCVGLIEVYPEDTVPQYLQKNGYMIVDQQNKCIALINGYCSIYNNRPDVCKRFLVDSPCCHEFYCDIKTEHKCTYCNLLK